ncbi:MAG: hypothetical protein J6J42_12600 [Lachnospiraceae bacterium]|nr:hypothetical protein [Lachnospiraceae bacterium]
MKKQVRQMVAGLSVIMAASMILDVQTAYAATTAYNVTLGTAERREMTEVTLKIGEKIDLNFYGVSDWGTNKYNYECTWNVSGDAVTVNEQGVVTAVKAGTARVTMEIRDVVTGISHNVTPVLISVPSGNTAETSGLICLDTSLEVTVKAVGEYQNWDGVTNVSQFLDARGNLCFAYDAGENIIVVKTEKGTPAGKQIILKKEAEVFGAVTCDEKGDFYVVTGRKNDTEDTTKDTIFITRYDAEGNKTASIGDNGSSSVAGYYGDSFYTAVPFNGGNCDIAVNGDYVAVNYARGMYSGHQSNALFVINKNSMELVKVESYYNSHSFAQRIVPYQDTFVLASEGDCFDRTFTISVPDIERGTCKDWDIFNFWVEDGTYDRYDMWVLNNNFAHMGGLAVGKENQVAFVSASVKSMNENARTEKEQLFIQIFEVQPDKTLHYVTEGIREGVAGPNGRTPATDKGVQWITDDAEHSVDNAQIVSDPEGNYHILFELYKGTARSQNNYLGVYYTVLDGNGKTVSEVHQISSEAYLNRYEMPVYADGTIFWVGNNRTDTTSLYIYSLPAAGNNIPE